VNAHSQQNSKEKVLVEEGGGEEEAHTHTLKIQKSQNWFKNSL
jgi:hypothetical protein